MKILKPITKKSGKHERERKVLLALIEYYIKMGKPVGSNTLKEVGFADLSSATIRNYFAHLEEEGYLLQQHTSGGRIPTDKAYRLYAEEYCLNKEQPLTANPLQPDRLHNAETREIAAFLQKNAEKLSQLTHTAVFLSAPRFEQDFIIGIKCVAIDADRCLCVLITDFGEIITEILHIEKKLSAFAVKRLEAYFNWRLNGCNKPDNLTHSEEELGNKLYNELLVRYIVNYSYFEQEEIHRTGFSTLLSYPEFHDASILANSLSLFENTQGMRLLLKECSKHQDIKFWIGDDLIPYSPKKTNCTVIAIPYFVNRQPVGAIGVLGPTRIPYRTAFSTLRHFADNITQTLTNSLYKFKISLRQPKTEPLDLHKPNLKLIGQTCHLLLEDNRSTNKDKHHAHNPASRRK